MRSTIVYGCVTWLTLALTACSARAPAGVGESEAPTGGGDSTAPGDSELCPGCELAGGETGDFGGGCDGQEQPVDAEVERDFGLPYLRSVLASSHTLEARWVDSARGEPVPGAGTTTIDVAVELGPVRLLTSESACGNRIEADVTVDVRTGDETLVATGHGTLLKWRDPRPVRVYARADMIDTAGTLDLEIDPSRPHRGQVEIVFDIRDDAMRGTVTPSVSYFAGEEQARDLAAWPAELQAPSVLRFPVDDCQMHELPLSADEPSALLGGRSPLDLLAEARSRLAELGPQPARWMDETLTEVEVDFSALAPAALCTSDDWLAPGNGEPLPSGASTSVTRLVGWAGATFRSADRGLDFAIANRVRYGDFTAFYVSPETGELQQLWLGRFEDEVDAAELQARLGLVLQVPASARLQADAYLLYTFTEGSAVEAEGRFQVLDRNAGAARIECISWPVGGRFEQDCRP